MKYKSGEKALVRQGLEANENYGNYIFFAGQAKYKIVTIVGVNTDYYDIKEDGGINYWTDEMLEPFHRELKDIQYGDVITDGEDFMYILDRHNDVVERGFRGDTIEVAKNSDHGGTSSLKEFIVGYKYWKIVGQEDEEIVEMTLEEIAELKGIDVKRLKIKK